MFRGTNNILGPPLGQLVCMQDSQTYFQYPGLLALRILNLGELQGPRPCAGCAFRLAAHQSGCSHALEDSHRAAEGEGVLIPQKESERPKKSAASQAALHVQIKTAIAQLSLSLSLSFCPAILFQTVIHKAFGHLTLLGSLPWPKALSISARPIYPRHSAPDIKPQASSS